MRFKWWQLSLVVVVAVSFQILFFVVAELGRLRLVSAEADVRRAYIQLTRVVDVYQLLMNAVSGHRGFLLTGDRTYLEPLHQAESRIEPLSTQLAETYQGSDERVRAAIGRLNSAANERMSEMTKAIEVYEAEGQAAALMVSNSASRHATMHDFREAAGITREYEQALFERSIANWEREQIIVGRLNVAMLLVGLMLAAIATISLVRTVRQRAEAVAEMERQHHELKAQFDVQARDLIDLAGHLQHAQEEERARLSRGLHDELGGLLLAARMDVTWMERHVPADDASVKQRLERVRGILDQGIELKRRVVEELRPTLLDTMGLVAAMRWQSDEICKRANFRCTERYPEQEPQLNRAGAIALFRVVQEALANVAKHAQANNVDISFEVTSQDVVLTVHDDGIGAQQSDLVRPRSHGLAGMRHRVNMLGGRLDISSGPNEGTTVRVTVPLANVTGTDPAEAGNSGTFATPPGAAAPGPGA